MAFVNLSLVAGSLLIGVPIVLHLLMRQRAKHALFPALQFLQSRREKNRRRLKLRHWCLLAMRCIAVTALALLLARPSVDALWFGDALLIGGILLLLVFVSGLAVASAFLRRGHLLTGTLGAVSVVLLVSLLVVVAGAASSRDAASVGDGQAPVAAVLAFDTAPRMDYRHQNQTRLEEARQTAEWLVRQLPSGSSMAVADGSLSYPVFLTERGATQRALAGLRITNAATPLLETVAQGLEVLQKRPDVRQELYVFTDLAAVEWETAWAEQVRQKLDEAPQPISLFLIDVGVPGPQNDSLGQLKLSTQQVAEGRSFGLSAELVHVGPGSERAVELYWESPGSQQPLRIDGELVPAPARRADRKMVQVSAGTPQVVQFSSSLVETGVHHGWLKLLGSDALAADDTLYFSVEVRQPSPVLIVAGPQAQPRFLSEALAPVDFPARFDCQIVSIDEWYQLQEWKHYTAICLVDPPPMSPESWRRLTEYVEQGGGLGVFLGRNASPVDQFQSSAARAVLPALLKPIVMRRPQGDVYLAPQHDSHPLFRVFRSVGSAVPWHAYPVFRHWLIDEKSMEGQTIISYSNNRPALLERQVGQGRVLMMTTSVSDAASHSEVWNHLPTGIDAWPFMVFVNETVRYLSGQANQRLNFTTGEAVTWKLDAKGPSRHMMFTPDGVWHDLHASTDELRIHLTEDPGTYRFVSANDDSQGGFSVNLPAASTDLRRTKPEHLDELLGKNGYTLVRTRDEIIREQGEARFGKEFFPYLGLFLAIVLGVEQLLANRFYRQENNSVVPQT